MFYSRYYNDIQQWIGIYILCAVHLGGSYGDTPKSPKPFDYNLVFKPMAYGHMVLGIPTKEKHVSG